MSDRKMIMIVSAAVLLVFAAFMTVHELRPPAPTAPPAPAAPSADPGASALPPAPRPLTPAPRPQPARPPVPPELVGAWEWREGQDCIMAQFTSSGQGSIHGRRGGQSFHAYPMLSVQGSNVLRLGRLAFTLKDGGLFVSDGDGEVELKRMPPRGAGTPAGGD